MRQRTAPPHRSSSKKAGRISRWRALRLGLSVLVVVVAGSYMVSRLGIEGNQELRRRLMEVDPAWLALAAGINFARYALWALRWRLLLRPLVNVRRAAAFKALMISILVNTLVPAARPVGGLIRARALTSSSGHQPGLIYGGTLLDQIGYSVVSAICGAFCIPWSLLPVAARTERLSWPLVGGLAVVISFLGWFLSKPARRQVLGRWLWKRLPRATETVAGALDASRLLAQRAGTYGLMAVGGTLVWFASAVVLMVAARAVGVPVTLHTAAAAWAVGSLAGAVSGTPGGMGATEGAALLPLTAAGIPLPAALAAILLARGLHYLSALLVGGGCWILSRPAAARTEDPSRDTTSLMEPEAALPASPGVPGGLPPQDRLPG